MEIKSLNWERTSFRRIKYNSKPRTSETWEARNKTLGNYKVWQSVSGRCFVEIPRYWEEKGSGSKHLSNGRKECRSVEEGKKIAEAHWQQQVEEVFTA